MNKNLQHNSLQNENVPASAIFDSENHSEKIPIKNNLLFGVILLIGVVGFLTAFSSQKDLSYNHSTLDNSFSNGSSSLASSSYQGSPAPQGTTSFDMKEQFEIKGFPEVGELLDFQLANFQSNSGVYFTIHFGNGDSKEITGKSTLYQYSRSGNYQIKITANYEGQTKEIFKKKIFIDDAIAVNEEAFTEAS